MSKDTKSNMEKGDRIAKVMARAGLCSRRDAEKWIALGRVSINGITLKTPGVVVREGDDVRVDGKQLPTADRARVWRFHKPKGLITTHKDEKGRTTVFEVLPSTMPRVVSVGRLDLTSEGLLLLTNDGALARELEHPSRGWVRRYRVRVHGRVDDKGLARLKNGVTVDGVRYGPIDAHVDKAPANEKTGEKTTSKSASKSNTWVTVALTEGKNREVRKVMEFLGLTVNRLIRVSYGPFQLGKLDTGGLEEVPAQVVRQQLGTTAPAGLNKKRQRNEKTGKKTESDEA
ncbi:MAG: rRNA pseudouridine synthase [Rhodospirillaceae bacterium]|nr:rRNA pseudouridine synthase [Rhodospirillaceae bacterium]